MLQLALWCVPALFIRAALGGKFDDFWEAGHDGPFPAGVPKLLRYLAYSNNNNGRSEGGAPALSGCENMPDVEFNAHACNEQPQLSAAALSFATLSGRGSRSSRAA